MARKLRPVSGEYNPRNAKRALAKELGFRSTDRLDRWIRRSRSYPESDPRYLRPGIADDDVVQLKRLREVGRKYKSPAERILEKKRILVDENEASVHMSAFAFLDRYIGQITQLLQSDDVTNYRKQQLNKMMADLQQKISDGNIGVPRQGALFPERELPRRVRRFVDVDLPGNAFETERDKK